MPLNADSLLDRMHLKAQLQKWRLIAIILGVFVAIALIGKTGTHFKSPYIAKVDVSGFISEDKKRDKLLAAIAKDDHVKGVIIYINSPGGSIVGAETLYGNIRNIARDKPVVAILGQTAASGGYMTAIAADHIFTRHGTITGSIGVLLQSAEITELGKKIGVNFLTYKSAALKGSPSPFEKTSPAVEKAIQSSIMDSYNFFVDLVAERRHLSRDQVIAVADGRILTGRQALAHKLVDGIGGETEAKNWLINEKNLDPNIEIKERNIKKPNRSIQSIVSALVGDSSYLENIMPNGLMTIWQSHLM